MSDNIYEGLTVNRGPAYRQKQVRSYSHYNDPIDRSEGRLAGNSRRHGDAPVEVQIAVMDRIAVTSRQKGLNARETGYVLSIARIESGFNPDAAAGTSSATGLGQFVKRTGQAYGINNSNIWDVDVQINALIDHYIYRVHAKTRRFWFVMIRKLSETVSRKFFHSLGMVSRKN